MVVVPTEEEDYGTQTHTKYPWSTDVPVVLCPTNDERQIVLLVIARIVLRRIVGIVYF